MACQPCACCSSSTRGALADASGATAVALGGTTVHQPDRCQPTNAARHTLDTLSGNSQHQLAEMS